ncbi:hypothetical protein N177_1715 [Lutibaculum baratangense AMV1]|uniref:RES domain-containing protein n=1 Tax=Lutibaculum baratangense AMV1 TaxID=631454 RepID=V4THV0_9HYPH|nr:RES family NAD+ phosphorylase [Lutibaculum baratangense]ESR25603.1 hypothetical protein N177_1715 [Lutibaculum baratangense AMV1]
MTGLPPVERVSWTGARRIIRSLYPPVDLFEDIADPEDWPAILSAEQKSNPRLVEGIGEIDLVPAGRRVGGAGSSYLMAPFTHVSPDRPSRFSDGSYGVLYVGRTFEVALAETIHHHARFMRATAEPPGWTSQFREIVMDVEGDLHAIHAESHPAVLDPDDYRASQAFARELRRRGSDGLEYPSVRCPGGSCAALFYPDLARNPVQGRHLDYHWDGNRVDLVREPASRAVFRVV